MKIVINKCWGGFGLSNKVCFILNLDQGNNGRDIDRANIDLIRCVEILGSEANGSCADLKVFEIPDGSTYEIQEEDGLETLMVTL